MFIKERHDCIDRIALTFYQVSPDPSDDFAVTCGLDFPFKGLFGNPLQILIYRIDGITLFVGVLNVPIHGKAIVLFAHLHAVTHVRPQVGNKGPCLFRHSMLGKVGIVGGGARCLTAKSHLIHEVYLIIL